MVSKIRGADVLMGTHLRDRRQPTPPLGTLERPEGKTGLPGERRAWLGDAAQGILTRANTFGICASYTLINYGSNILHDDDGDRNGALGECRSPARG